MKFAPILIGLILGQTSFPIGVGAQSPPIVKPVPPQGTLLKSPENFSKWEIKYRYSNDDPEQKEPSMSGVVSPQDLVAPIPIGGAAPIKLRRMVVTFTRPFWYVIAIDTEGKKAEQWSDGVNQFSERPKEENEKAPMLVPKMKGYTSTFDFGESGFPDLDWVSKETFVGMQDFKGVSCMVFQKQDATAYVSLKDRYPVELQTRGETRSFRQLPPPSAMITLPKSVMEYRKSFEDDAKLLNQARKPRF